MFEGVESRVRELARRAGLGDVAPGVLIAVCVLGIVACAWALWRWWPSGAGVSETSAAPLVTGEQAPQSAPSQEASSGEPSATPAIIVHVAGAVRHPGVVELEAGARVIDAVDAVGGTLPDAVLTGVNLARELVDGEQVVVPDEDTVASGGGAPGAPAGATGATGAGAGVSAAKVNVNTADQTLLETLPGVGPSTATKIIADRESNGPYQAPEDLRRVSGIGEKKLEAIRDLISVR